MFEFFKKVHTKINSKKNISPTIQTLCEDDRLSESHHHSKLSSFYMLQGFLPTNNHFTLNEFREAESVYYSKYL